MRNSLQRFIFPIYLFSAAAFTNIRPDLRKNEAQNTIKDSIPANDFRRQHSLPISKASPSEFSKEVFVRAQLSKAESFVGEPLVVTYKLYSAINGRSSMIGETTNPGFSKLSLPAQPDLTGHTETYNGRKYQVHILKKTILVPQFSGSLEVDQLKMLHKLYLTKKNAKGKRNTEIGEFIKETSALQSSARSVSYTSKSLPAKIIVHDLPEPVPQDFSGAVGTFQIAAKVSTQTTRAGEIINLAITIDGFGNLDGVEPPQPSLPPGTKLVSVKQGLNDKKPNQELSVERKFDYVISIEEAKSFSLPPIRFCYFNPADNSYKTIETTGIPIRVADFQIVNVPKVNLKRPHQYIFHILLSSSIIIVMLGLFIRKKLKKLQPVSTEKGASAVDEKLISIERQVEAGDLASFKNLHALLWDSFSESLGLRPTELTRKNVLNELDRRGWNESDKSKAEYLINAYEEYLYLPGLKKVPNIQSTYEETRDLLSRLEK